MMSGPQGAPSLSVVVPLYNEEARIERLCDTFRTSAEHDIAGAGMELLEAVMVDDASGDRTVAVLRRAAKVEARIVPLLGVQGNEGKGAAFARGVRAARGEFVLLMDADLAVPLTEVAKLYDQLRRGADMAIGSRDLPGSILTGTPAYRRAMGRLFNRGVRHLTGLPFRDTQCGFKLMPTPLARSLVADQLVPGFAFDVELLMRARGRTMRIVEVPVHYHHGDDSSLSPVRTAFRMSYDVVRLRRALLRQSAHTCPTTNVSDSPSYRGPT